MNAPTDIARFNDLYDRYRTGFVRFAESYVRDREAAENLISDAFVYYWEHRADIASDENLPAYILTVVKHKCLNHLRREKLSADITGRLRAFAEWDQATRIASLEACDPQYLFSQEIREIIERTLASLPEQTRRIFRMSREEHLPQREIAALSGMTVKGVEFHMHKALLALREALKDYYVLAALFFFEQ